MKKDDIYKACSILATMFTILGISLFNISPIMFLVIISVCIVVIIIELIKIYLEYKRRLNKAKKFRNSNLYKKYFKNIRIAIFIMFVVTIPTCIKNRKVMIVYANKIFTTIEKIASAEEPVTEPAEEPVTEPAEEPVDISINTWTEFKLEYPEGYPWIDDNEYNNLYREIFYSEDIDGLNEITKSKIVVWLNSCTPNTPLDNAVTSDEKSITYFLEIESIFSNKGDVILSSDLLDEVIMGRKELLELYPNGTSAWILANHMQTYALNYLYQSYPTKDEKSIMYLYMKAINYTQKSLEFEMDISKKCERIRYIQSRYKDIAECKIVNTDIRLRAYEIYTNIQEELNELQIP